MKRRFLSPFASLIAGRLGFSTCQRNDNNREFAEIPKGFCTMASNRGWLIFYNWGCAQKTLTNVNLIVRKTTYVHEFTSEELSLWNVRKMALH